MHRAPEQIGSGGFVPGRDRMKPDKKRNVALESARERQVNPASWLFFEERVASCRHDADYFNRLSPLLFFTHIGAASDVTTFAALGRCRICRRVLNVLTKRITIRPKFLRQNFVNDRDFGAGLGRLRFGERATANDRQSNGWKIIRAHAVPWCFESKPVRGSRRLGVRSKSKTGALDFSG